MNQASIEVTELGKPDVIVVGSGPCGLIVVRECLKHNLNVLLIDSGTEVFYPYSVNINDKYQKAKTNLGGIGGTARVWHGQIVRFPPNLEFFEKSRFWTYSKYTEESKSVEKLFGVNFDDKSLEEISQKFEQSISPKGLPIRLKNTFVVRKSTNWEKLFRGYLENKKCVKREYKVKRLILDSDHVVEIECESGVSFAVESTTLVVLAANSLANKEILKGSRLRVNDAQPFKGLLETVYDHPFKIVASYQLKSANRMMNYKMFYRPIRNCLKVKIRRKFVVYDEGKEIGLFELRPRFGDKYESNIVLRMLNNVWILFFRRYLFRVREVDLWVQIEMADPIIYDPLGEGFSNCSVSFMNPANIKRFSIVSSVAKDYLKKVFSQRSEFDLTEFDGEPEEAHHPSGTIAAGYDKDKVSFNFEGESLEYTNLFLTGGAIISSGSWVNPTVPIMVLAQGNIRRKIREFFSSK